MEDIIIGYFIIWVILAFLVALVGKNKEIGYWLTFTVSLFLSPVIALIIAALSRNLNSNQDSKYGKHRFKSKLDEAKKAEYKGHTKIAIDLYMDTLYYLENDYKNMKGEFEMKRLDLIQEVTKKVELLKKLSHECNI